MDDLHIYLTDGFEGDHVVVSVDGREVFDQRGVTTKKLYGLAEEVGPVSVAGSTAAVSIELPEKGLSAKFSLDLSHGRHVPIAVEDGRLRHSVEKQLGFA